MQAPTNFPDALSEIDRLRYQLKAALRTIRNYQGQDLANQDELDQMILFGDSRPGHEFDVI